jgi:hypothetical protein
VKFGFRKPKPQPPKYIYRPYDRKWWKFEVKFASILPRRVEFNGGKVWVWREYYLQPYYYALWESPLFRTTWWAWEPSKSAVAKEEFKFIDWESGDIISQLQDHA